MSNFIPDYAVGSTGLTHSGYRTCTKDDRHEEGEIYVSKPVERIISLFEDILLNLLKKLGRFWWVFFFSNFLFESFF